MKTFTRTRLLAAAALTAATFTTPAIAYAGNYSSSSYEDCKKSDTEAQIIGGVLGALAGGVLGSNVAGGGVQDEGTAIGAAAGAAAGIALANKDCKKRNGIYTDRTSDRRYATTRRTPVRTVSYNGNSRGYNRGYTNHSTYNRGYGYDDRGYGGFRNKRQVRREIERLKREADELRRRKYDRRSNPRRLAARLSEVKREIKWLKKIEDRFEDRQDRRRDYRRDTRRDYGQRSHYHGADICYSDH